MASSDRCPKCGADLEFDEVDIGVGTMQGNPGCPNCWWTPEFDRKIEANTCPYCGAPYSIKAGGCEANCADMRMHQQIVKEAAGGTNH